MSKHENSTFASRAARVTPEPDAEIKQVDAEVDEVEDKAIKPAETKSRTRKS